MISAAKATIVWNNKKMKRTLYVTDLDGTLMKNDKSISDNSIKTINELIKNGLAFTYATARSVVSSSEITNGINFTLPVITRNGTALSNNHDATEIDVEIFEEDEVDFIRKIVAKYDLAGIVTSFINGKESKNYMRGYRFESEGFRSYLEEHSDDKRMRQVFREEDLYEGEVFYFAYIDDKKVLDPLYEELVKDVRYNIVYQKDNYRPEYWMEICPKNASKAKAIKKLMKMHSFDKLIVFGDSLNDISMFEMADEGYAVENACNELKQIATNIIKSNEEDGVAAFLKSNYVNS